MINVLLDPSDDTAGPAVFDDPSGRRRRVMTAAGAVVCAGCLLALAAAAGIVYADPHAPAPPGAVTSNTAR
ncbi:hypothetical protein IPZ70_01700 [Streptomyces polychromogenes]|nr:hypothetical protein [Streptomyces polychromogenes]